MTETTAQSAAPAPLLRLRGISKSYGAVRALQDIDFQVASGEVVGLVGDNGAGKSTLIRVMSGVGPPDKGEIWFDGRQVALNKPHDAVSLGIATVYQDLALCDNLNVAENLFLGREAVRKGPLGFFRLVDRVEMGKRSRDLLQTLRVTIPDVRTVVGSLSGGQRQAVATVRSVLGNPRIILLDEPTAALGVAQTKQVLSLIDRLRKEGHGVVVISHSLSDVFAVADRISVLRLGRNAGEYVTATTTREEVVAAITGLSEQQAANTIPRPGAANV